jgi:hypothetical protein
MRIVCCSSVQKKLYKCVGSDTCFILQHWATFNLLNLNYVID